MAVEAIGPAGQLLATSPTVGPVGP
jgi:hypothetical protein